MDFTRIWRAESCRQVAIPSLLECLRATGEDMVNGGLCMAAEGGGQVESILSLHRLKLRIAPMDQQLQVHDN